MSVQFGIIDHIDRQAIPIFQTFDERLEQIRRFDADGFYAYHLTEHHFTVHGMAPSPITFLAAAARITKQIRLVPTVLVMPTYHPLRLAEEICMLDHLSHGRFEFGVGRGIVPHELSLFGINPHEAPDIMKEGFEVLMKALTQETVSHRGEYYKFFKVPMELRPVQQPHPPLWITSGTVEAARLAGRAGNSMMLIRKPIDCRPITEAFMEEWSKSHSGSERCPKLGLTRHLYVASSQKEAEERGMFGFRGWYRSHSAIWKRFDSSRGDGDEAHYTRSRALIFGTPEFVKAELQQQLDDAGAINYLVPRFSFGDLSHEESMRSYDLFRTEVMPHFMRRPVAASLSQPLPA